MSMVVLAYVFCIQLDLYKYNKSLLLSRQGPYKQYQYLEKRLLWTDPTTFPNRTAKTCLYLGYEVGSISEYFDSAVSSRPMSHLSPYYRIFQPTAVIDCRVTWTTTERGLRMVLVQVLVLLFVSYFFVFIVLVATTLSILASLGSPFGWIVIKTHPYK